ncbi:hypothetical protein P7C71_g5964, partial [Lecanoromycetidae sp. Uapishka_2]
MGLDYGWGPTAFVETLIEHVHIYAGTPWWASIAISMLIIRGVLLKFYFDAADTSARNQLIQEHMKPITDRWKAAAVAQDRGAMQEASLETRKMRQAAGVKMWKIYQPPTSPLEAPEKSKGFLGGALSDIQGAVSEVVKGGKKILDKNKAEAGKRTAAEHRHAKDYDARRKREQAQQKFEKQQEQESKAREKTERRRRQNQ